MDLMRSSPSAPDNQRAIVIGGSIAGLLAARVLSEHYRDIVVLERDALPDAATLRKGTPQAGHPHGLLARGLEVLEELFPGFTTAMIAQGATPGDIGLDIAVDANRRRFKPVSVGVTGLGVSRAAIEAELRRRVRACPGVAFMTGVSVETPLHAAERVIGVRFHALDHPAAQDDLSAALVVDCTGRGSRSPNWLRAWGYEPPPEDKVTIDIAYTSAYFRRNPNAGSGPAAVLGSATPALPKPYVLIPQEPDESGQCRWVAGLGGYGSDRVELSLEGMARRASEAGCGEIAALTQKGEILGAPVSYVFPHSQRRRYEKLRRFPAGYLVMGDAIASFNPIYGQGMTVAACEALALRDALAGAESERATRFFRAISKVVDIPWQLAVGGDLALPQVAGHRSAQVRLINAYVGKVQAAAADDPQVAAAFIKVIHMLAAPATLFAPGMVWRVLRHRPASAEAPAPVASPAAA